MIAPLVLHFYTLSRPSTVQLCEDICACTLGGIQPWAAFHHIGTCSEPVILPSSSNVVSWLCGMTMNSIHLVWWTTIIRERIQTFFPACFISEAFLRLEKMVECLSQGCFCRLPISNIPSLRKDIDRTVAEQFQSWQGNKK